jgi:hypothetical protein
MTKTDESFVKHTRSLIKYLQDYVDAGEKVRTKVAEWQVRNKRKGIDIQELDSRYSTKYALKNIINNPLFAILRLQWIIDDMEGNKND